MSSKFTMLAGSGMTALALLGTASAAEARTHHKMRHVAHKHHAAVAKSGNASELAELKAQVESLTARLEAQEAAQRITADQAASASATAMSADANATAMSTKLADSEKAVASQVKSAINAGAPKANWAADTTVSGRMYFNISNINQQAGAGKIVPSGTGFDIKRLYVGVNHTFNKNWSAQAVIDGQANNAYSANANLNGSNFYIKNAFLQYKLNDALQVRFGAADMPWIPFVEGIYGYRYVEQTVTDRTNYANSADWGVHALGTLGDAKKLNLTYALSAVNGGGYKNPTRSNSVDLEGRVALNYMGVTAAVGGYTGKYAKDAQNVLTLHTATRFSALLAYTGPKFRVGAEYFNAKDGLKNGSFITSVLESNSWGYSAFGSYNVTPKLAVFGRYDTVKPNTYAPAAGAIPVGTLLPSTYENYYNFGVTYSPAKIVDLSLVYKRDAVKSSNLSFAPGNFSTANGTVGSTIVGQQGTYDEIGLFGQFRF